MLPFFESLYCTGPNPITCCARPCLEAGVTSCRTPNYVIIYCRGLSFALLRTWKFFFTRSASDVRVRDRARRKMAASSAAHTSAPFSRPVIKKRSKTERAVMQPPALPRMSSKERKRARPSDGFAEDKPASARRLSDRSQDVYKRGMFLSFVESALDEYRTARLLAHRRSQCH